MKKNLLFLMVLAASLLFSAGGFASGLNGDFDHDGDVDGEDLTVFSENFGTTAGRCTENSNCESDLYCAKSPGDCDGIGGCLERPDACFDLWDPVCGCDGETYANACEAAAAGLNILIKGACRDTHCDDGTDVLCDMIPPVCRDFEILVVQNNCWVCVNPATCLPWGEPECDPSNDDCPDGFTCDPCGTSSCPFCDDCLPACVP